MIDQLSQLNVITDTVAELNNNRFSPYFWCKKGLIWSIFLLRGLIKFKLLLSIASEASSTMSLPRTTAEISKDLCNTSPIKEATSPNSRQVSTSSNSKTYFLKHYAQKNHNAPSASNK